MSRQTNAWDVFVAGLSPGARAVLNSDTVDPLLREPPDSAEDDETAAYAAALLKLSPDAGAVLSHVAAAARPPQVVAGKARFCLVEIPDGQWPKLRAYKSADALARRLQVLNDQDVSVWCYYGIPLKVSKDQPRYLELPNGYQFVTVPPFAGVPPTTVDAAAVGDVEWETRGYLGPAYLAEVQPTAADEVPATAGGADELDDD